MTATEDRELLPWLLGVANGKPTPAGDFLRTLVDAAFRADFLNYEVLRPALVEMAHRFPKYNDPCLDPYPCAPRDRR